MEKKIPDSFSLPPPREIIHPVRPAVRPANRLRHTRCRPGHRRRNLRPNLLRDGLRQSDRRNRNPGVRGRRKRRPQLCRNRQKRTVHAQVRPFGHAPVHLSPAGYETTGQQGFGSYPDFYVPIEPAAGKPGKLRADFRLRTVPQSQQNFTLLLVGDRNPTATSRSSAMNGRRSPT